MWPKPQSLAGIERNALRREQRSGGNRAELVVAGLESIRDCVIFLAQDTAGRIDQATAGLHHAVRGEYRLTYEPGAPTGEMFGFLNVAVAAALVWHNRNPAAALAVLGERSMDAFSFAEGGLAWRDERLSVAELDEVRSRFFVGFGSCSFSEPMAEIGLEAQPRA